MSGHNKFSKIKHLKAKNDAEKSKIYTKLVRLISVEAKKSGGNTSAPGLAAALAKAREENMPNDTVERAIKKATADNSASLEAIIYEAYGPGGVAILIEALTENRNKAAQEIKHILSDQGISLAAPGSASWAFEKKGHMWQPTTTVPLEEAGIVKLSALVDALEANDEVQEVFTNAE